MEHSFKTGLGFGSTSGIITTLGLITGLHSGTHSRVAILGGIITIAVADAFSDALGIHVSEELEGIHTQKEIWQATFSTFLSKFFTAISFIFPFLMFSDSTAMIVSIVWGLLLLAYFNFRLSTEHKEKTLKAVAEHIFIALVVIILSHFIGDFINATFGGG